jgi:hypothetical protein
LLGSLTAILDVCTLVKVAVDGMCQYQARMTFAIARHALVDLSQIFAAAPVTADSFNRLPAEDLVALRRGLREAGFIPLEGEHVDEEMARMRSLYEPYALALARHLCIDLPPWIKHEASKDNWKTTAWKPLLSEAAGETALSREEHW